MGSASAGLGSRVRDVALDSVSASLVSDALLPPLAPATTATTPACQLALAHPSQGPLGAPTGSHQIPPDPTGPPRASQPRPRPPPAAPRPNRLTMKHTIGTNAGTLRHAMMRTRRGSVFPSVTTTHGMPQATPLVYPPVSSVVARQRSSLHIPTDID
ncbi:hypothetical protein N7495_003479 [Penicillium taxi]|uniref:uncharacterized protein n=1 Tax=Penicillium taxi TaxID=168475 RepID=UPI0025455E73|nr:uncharacterized protein N7495_003472 [Penicillium taxi]XP_057066743.1 uncharacterized protein N7495_003479 [Penicillium taxi]KAJ5902944.1 hypothetical protein N7495_003472 [Penicillium taxi]KAJ5902951.1 hypothetical protein N7495_003479 [Penicillium taxi]